MARRVALSCARRPGSSEYDYPHYRSCPSQRPAHSFLRYTLPETETAVHRLSRESTHFHSKCHERQKIRSPSRCAGKSHRHSSCPSISSENESAAHPRDSDLDTCKEILFPWDRCHKGDSLPCQKPEHKNSTGDKYASTPAV